MKTNIRYIRKLNHMTLAELSESTGLTSAYLSMIERDMREPTLSTLRKIADALGVTAESLWTDIPQQSVTRNPKGYQLMTAESREPKNLYPGVFYESLTENALVEGRTRGLIGHFGRLMPGAVSNPNLPASHEEDELTFVIRGEMTVILGEERVLLQAGDSLLVRPGMTHNYINESKEPVEFVMVRYA